MDVYIDQKLWNAVVRLLEDSWTDINFSYYGLTAREKALITEEQHTEIMRQIKGLQEAKRQIKEALEDPNV